MRSDGRLGLRARATPLQLLLALHLGLLGAHGQQLGVIGSSVLTGHGAPLLQGNAMTFALHQTRDTINSTCSIHYSFLYNNTWEKFNKLVKDYLP